MENLKGFRYSTAAKCVEITIFDQKQPFETYAILCYYFEFKLVYLKNLVKLLFEHIVLLKTD